MFKLKIKKHTLNFAFPAGTSRGLMHKKDTWYVLLSDIEKPGVVGMGECSPIWGLSPEKEEEYEEKLNELSSRIEQFDFYLRTGLAGFPSIRFGLETALLDFYSSGKHILFPTDFTKGNTGIRINGLVWMGEPEKMLSDALDKVNAGYTCIKIKIGTHDWQEEEKIIRALREKAGNTIEIRVDANGAYSLQEAKQVMKRCAAYNVHSIEQPVKQGNISDMKALVAEKSVPVALDEELIGVISTSQRNELLKEIKPSYIVIKPSLVGGLAATREWINLAEEQGIKWWITSALESNIGLNAIAQFAATINPAIAQGLGTGKIYTNNIPSPLEIKGDRLFYNPFEKWDFRFAND
ncbi:MAG: o-succinylbenzoate synthase [Flavobacteriales bacterium]